METGGVLKNGPNRKVKRSHSSQSDKAKRKRPKKIFNEKSQSRSLSNYQKTSKFAIEKEQKSFTEEEKHGKPGRRVSSLFQ